MAGEDLLQYLIIPQPASSSTINCSSSSVERERERRVGSVSDDEESAYWRCRGRLQADGLNMEVDTATPAHSVPDEIMETTAPDETTDRVVSLSDYLATYTPPAPKSKPFVPVPHAIGARSSKYTILLHERYQKLGIPKPDFVFTGGSEQGWGCRVVFAGLLREGEEDVELEEEGPFGSKQEAKERLSERALGVLDGLEKEGKISKKPKEKRMKETAAESKSVGKEKEPGTNYVGQLLEFQRSINSPPPTYQDYQLGTSFSCELLIDGHTSPFSSRTTYFTSKKAARQDAARCAIEHFKSTGLWPDTFTDTGGIKKKKPTHVQPLQPPKTRSPSNASPFNPDGVASSGTSYAQQVAQLAAQLSLPTPLWSFSAESAAPGFHTVSCHFKNAGAHEGPIGEVRHIFGKKKAKEECARLTLEYLLGVMERRMSHSRLVMGGLEGGENNANIALGKPTGDDAGV